MNNTKQFHLQITFKEVKPPHRRIEWSFDLSVEDLEKRYLRAYREGRPFLINGRPVALNEIHRTRVYSTERKIENLAKIPWPLMQNVTDEYISGPPGYGALGGSPITRSPSSSTTMKIFISHNGNDVGIAKLLVELLRDALNLKSTDIRCTSVDGYRLPGGASVDETLRAEVHDTELLIGLISPTSLKSAYVLFELGARWGAGKPLIPLLASGATPDHMGGPLAGINALDASQIGQLHQLVEEAAGHLSIARDKPSSYTAVIEELAMKSAIPSTLGQLSADDDTAHLSEGAKELLSAAKGD